MKRFFSKRKKWVLRILSGNLCSECGQKLKSDFHADHIIPFVKAGPTILQNGQALCVRCNLMKGADID